MQNNTTCQLMEELSSSNVLTSSLLFTLLSCAIIIPMALLASYHLWFSRTASLFHKNLRIIIQFHLLGFLIHSGGRFILHSIDLFNYLFEDPCDMIPNVWRCFWLRLIYAIGLWITSTTVIPLVLERWIATKYSNRYESTGCLVGVVLVVLQSVVCAVHILILYSGSQIEGVVMAYCMVARDSKVNVGEINGYATVVVQLLARFFFQYLYKRNEKLRKEQLASSLSTRFQLEQNLLVMDILKMFANMSTIYLGLHAFSFIGVLKLKHIVTPPVYFALVELNSSYPIYGIVSILLMYYMLHSNRQKIHNNLQIHVNSKWNGECFDKR
ncbi:hypothetical protein GCK72_018124 [Caenorhabditis remanei]|uniref:Uncharacterized protein n=1 Tax=Caenorhabditis remanei TaxID=31234 RepID=A0A6A5G989_CAERE|nr:hypothetical protein GCK72_018124 [Caenorhabditis remanei]KAF1751570.1 hypothetical protein GCK72_018124 [Caenorhabditis remanei]